MNKLRKINSLTPTRNSVSAFSMGAELSPKRTARSNPLAVFHFLEHPIIHLYRLAALALLEAFIIGGHLV